MKKAIVIPTYWGTLNASEEVVFDHPTPLNTKGTLSRLLNNLIEFDDVKDIPIYIIGVSNKQSLNEEVEEYLKKYLEPFNEKLNIKLYSYSFLKEVKEKLEDKKDLSYLIDLKGYSKVRNFSLLPIIVDDIDVAIFLDDDEIVEDKDYFEKAIEFLGKETNDGKIYGKAGYYLNRGGYKLPTDNIPPWEKCSWNKIELMNETFEKLIESDKRLSKTDIALGGNMVLTKEIMKNICYDINIPRGEDMDYVFNAKIFDYLIVFDNELKITHLPPEHSSVEWKNLRSDINRFKYAGQKLENLKNHKELNQINLDEMMSYPGEFLKDDFHEKARDSMRLLGMNYLFEGEMENYDEILKNISLIYSIKDSDVDFVDEYKKQLEDWKTMVLLLVN